MAPTWQTPDGRVRLYLADCLAVRQSLEGIDAIVSDPPYGVANDCNYSRFTSGPNSHGEASSRTYAPIIGDDQPFDPSPWLDYKSVILWGYNNFADKLPRGSALVWIKRLDGGFGSFLSDAELAWKKGGCGVYCHRDTSLFGETRDRVHPTQKPVGLMRWAMSFLPVGVGTVCDPYMGSGTTGVACVRDDRSFVGIERDPHYFATAVKRIEAELNRTPLFDDPAPIQRELI